MPGIALKHELSAIGLAILMSKCGLHDIDLREMVEILQRANDNLSGREYLAFCSELQSRSVMTDGGK